MNLFWKILYWTLTIALGFVNPVITFVLVIFYYLPEIFKNSQTNHETTGKNHQYQNKMKFFSKETKEDLK